MDITLFVGSVSGGGAERVICELAKFLKKNGHNAHILTVTQTEESYLTDKTVVVDSLDRGLTIHIELLRKVTKMFSLFKFVLMSKTDLYVVFLPDTILALTMLKPFIKAPIVSSERNNPTSYSEKLQKRLVKASRKVEGSVYQTDIAREFYVKNNRQLKNPIIIPNAVANAFIDSPETKKEKRIVAVGRFKEQKNFPLLIKSFARIIEKHPEYSLFIYGEGELLDEYEKLTHKLGISEKVTFPGYITNINEELSKASLFVLSSDYEGMPNALIEAMAMGLPCISTDCGGGPRYLIKNKVNGVLVPVNDIEMLANEMDCLLSDKYLANRLSEEARKISMNLSPNCIYKQWEEYLSRFQ